MKTEPLSAIKYSKDITNYDFEKNYRLNQIKPYYDTIAHNPNISKIEACKITGISPSTCDRIRKELNLISPFRFNKKINRRSKKKTQKIKAKNKTKLTKGGTIKPEDATIKPEGGEVS
jgi:hypothetical protein